MYVCEIGRETEKENEKKRDRIKKKRREEKHVDIVEAWQNDGWFLIQVTGPVLYKAL